MLDEKLQQVIGILRENPTISSSEVYDRMNSEMSYATLKRILKKLLAQNLIQVVGKGKGTKYLVGNAYNLLYPIDVETYFKDEIDDRAILDSYNMNLITEVLNEVSLFSAEDLDLLNGLQNTYKDNISHLSSKEYSLELERLAIDLSWKSSQIEGNTYSLLETERLLKEQETADGKRKDDATMLLNHKEALDFIISEPNYVAPLTISSIEDIHSLLINGLGVERNIRTRRVGISGTNYKPLDNEHQIKEALQGMCDLVNKRTCVFEKSLLLLVLISYIQAFGDGNKRTARIISNAVLINNGYCPVSFRTINSVEYKKAMLLFYEQNNIHAFKQIFISQFEFAVKTYF